MEDIKGIYSDLLDVNFEECAKEAVYNDTIAKIWVRLIKRHFSLC